MGIVAESLRRAIATAEEGNHGFTVTLESREDPDRWIQLTWDAINVSFPLQTEPTAELFRRGFTFPEHVELVAWEAGKFATFEHGAEPFAELVVFVERYAREVLRVEPDGSAFTLSTVA